MLGWKFITGQDGECSALMELTARVGRSPEPKRTL